MKPLDKALHIIGALALLALLIGAMSIAADDDAQAQAHYCAMTADGYWPDYDPSINCGGSAQ